MGFEPCAVWHDDASIITDESAKVFLRNVLGQSKTQVRELRVEADKKRREVENGKNAREGIRQGKDKRNEVDVVRGIFYLQEALHEVERKWVTAEVETSTILSVAGDLSLGAKNHNFRSQTFKIPTNCDLCGERIWGLSAKGFDCRDCGYTCHSKCQMKVPAECPGEQTKEDKKKLKVQRQEQAGSVPAVDGDSATASSAAPSLTRQNTMNSLSSGYAASTARSASVTNVAAQATPESPAEAAPAPVADTKPATAKRHRVLAPPPTTYVSAPPISESTPAPRSQEPRGKMVYAFQATGADEVTVHEGDDVAIVEPDGKCIPSFHSTCNYANLIQTDLAGCVSAWALKRVSFHPHTLRPRRRHRPRHRLARRSLIDRAQYTQPPLPRWQGARRLNAWARQWRPAAAPRKFSTSKPCTSMRRAVMQSGRWRRAIDLFL